jgi:hypothetical protein
MFQLHSRRYIEHIRQREHRLGKNWKPSSAWLRRKAKQGFQGYPVATIAFYGPTAALATKVVVGIVRDEGQDPDPLERWFSEDTDVRSDPAISEKILAFLKEHSTRSVIATDGSLTALTKKALITSRENPVHSAPTGPVATGSRANASTETRVLR